MAKDRKPRGRERQIGLEQALEFQERLVVEDDVVDVVERDAGLVEAIGDRVLGKAGIALARVKRSSCAAATMRPSSTRAAALS